MVGLLVEVPPSAGGGGVGGKDHVQQLVHPLVHLRLGEAALLEGGEHLPVAVAHGAGHLQITSGPDAGALDVAAAPVGDHHTVKAPLLPEDVGEEGLVLVGVGTVDFIVGGHDGLGMALLHGDLKIGQVQLPQGPLIHHAVAGHAQQLLGVGGEVLGAGGDAVLLHALDEGGGQLARQIGVLRVVLEIAPAQRAALGVQAGAQQDIDLEGGGLAADDPAGLTGQLRVPAVGDAGGGGEAGGGETGVQAQVVPRPRLLAHAVGAVGEEHAGHSRLSEGIGAPHVPAGEKRHLLLQRQPIQNILVFHSKAPFTYGRDGPRRTGDRHRRGITPERRCRPSAWPFWR